MNYEYISKLEKLGKIALFGGGGVGCIIIIMGLKIASTVSDITDYMNGLSSLNFIPFFLMIVGAICIVFGVVIHQITVTVKAEYRTRK